MTDTNEYKVKLVSKRDVASGTTAFTFERPLGFTFTAGQNMDITLIDPKETDAEGNTRTFSFVNAPHEQGLTVATRMRDTAFKRTLGALPIGSSVMIKGPFGDFRLHNDAGKPAVFLIGGIGITPVHSMIVDATERSLPHKLTLLYSNRRPEDAPFFAELAEFVKKNPNFRFVPTMTEPEKSASTWTGEKGPVNVAMLGKYVADLKAPVYYLSGPAGMVKAMRDLLTGAGVDTDNIRTEEFPGY